MLPTNAPFFFFKLYFKTERSEEASHARSSERRRRQKPSLDDPRSPSSSVPSLLPFTCFSSFSLNYLVLCRLCLYMGNEQEMGRKKTGGGRGGGGGEGDEEKDGEEVRCLAVENLLCSLWSLPLSPLPLLLTSSLPSAVFVPSSLHTCARYECVCVCCCVCARAEWIGCDTGASFPRLSGLLLIGPVFQIGRVMAFRGEVRVRVEGWGWWGGEGVGGGGIRPLIAIVQTRYDPSPNILPSLLPFPILTTHTSISAPPFLPLTPSLTSPTPHLDHPQHFSFLCLTSHTSSPSLFFFLTDLFSSPCVPHPSPPPLPPTWIFSFSLRRHLPAFIDSLHYLVALVRMKCLKPLNILSRHLHHKRTCLLCYVATETVMKWRLDVLQVVFFFFFF